jgi:anthranilate phosphoribosyltransferase
MDPLTEALGQLSAGANLTEVESHDAVAAIIDGRASEVAISAFLTSLRLKGETAEELTGAVRAVRARMTRLESAVPGLLDTCGTGGDAANTVNISTAVAVVVAACGVPVAKHGNRSASGNSGSAEVLTELGVVIEAEPDVLKRCLTELGITFLFAPRFHPALRFAAPVRKQLPFRTLFNLIGPLANPAQPAFQLVGVPNERLADLVARGLASLGVERAAVVTGSDGLDEVTLAGPTRVRWVEGGRIDPVSWEPGDFGLPAVPGADLRVSGPADSAHKLRSVFAGEAGPIRAVLLANAAAALRVAGRVASLEEGVRVAAEAIDTGGARELLRRWAALSQTPTEP